MAQQALVLGPNTGGTPVHQVVDDYGPIGQGASQARTVLAENGMEYIIKGPALTPGHRYVGANELIVARLASGLALPLLDFALVVMGTDVYFASSFMASGSFYQQTTQDLFNRCLNRYRVYDIATLDLWVCNVDRHHQNLLVRHQQPRQGQAERYLLLLNDHSHCMVLPGETPSVLSGRISAPVPPYVHLTFVREAICDPAELGAAVKRVEELSVAAITNAVQTTPDQLLPPQEHGVVLQFLLERRLKLRQLLEDGRGHFPNLAGGAL